MWYKVSTAKHFSRNCKAMKEDGNQRIPGITWIPGIEYLEDMKTEVAAQQS